MNSRIAQIFVLAAISLSSVYAGTASVAAASAVSTTRTAATPREAVLLLVRPFYDRSNQSAACNAVMGSLANCPITARLRGAIALETRWERNHTRGGNGNEFCRCQNTPLRVAVSVVQPPYTVGSTQFSQVRTTWYWGNGPTVIDWLIRRTAGGWRVDNQYCAGHPNQDLYHIPVGPCPQK